MLHGVEEHVWLTDIDLCGRFDKSLFMRLDEMHCYLKDQSSRGGGGGKYYSPKARREIFLKERGPLCIGKEVKSKC